MRIIEAGNMSLQDLLDELWTNREGKEEWSVTVQRSSQGGYTAFSKSWHTDDNYDRVNVPCVGHGDSVESAVRSLTEVMKAKKYI